jgi:hypothetical protein
MMTVTPQLTSSSSILSLLSARLDYISHIGHKVLNTNAGFVDLFGRLIVFLPFFCGKDAPVRQREEQHFHTNKYILVASRMFGGIIVFAVQIYNDRNHQALPKCQKDDPLDGQEFGPRAAPFEIFVDGVIELYEAGKGKKDGNIDNHGQEETKTGKIGFGSFSKVLFLYYSSVVVGEGSVRGEFGRGQCIQNSLHRRRYCRCKSIKEGLVGIMKHFVRPFHVVLKPSCSIVVAVAVVATTIVIVVVHTGPILSHILLTFATATATATSVLALQYSLVNDINDGRQRADKDELHGHDLTLRNDGTRLGDG